MTAGRPALPRRRAVGSALVVAVTLGLATAGPLVAQSAPLVPPPQSGTSTLPQGWPSAPAVTASAYLLLDAHTGQVLAQRAADHRRPVASTVKMLTALTVLRRTEPTDVVTVGPEVVGVGGAGVGLQPGDRWSIADLLEGLIARSGNDAATALAVHVAGSVDRFVALMRQDAQDLGLGDVVLVSPSGLQDRNRLSARDLAVIARAAMTDPVFRAAAARPVVELPSGSHVSRNELLDSYPGAIGIKTGFTQAAGYALIAAAERGDEELIAVVLDSRDPAARFTDAATLLDHGFDGFTAVPIGGEVVVKVPGDTIALDAGPADVLVPGTAPGLDVTPLLPVEPDAAPETIVASWDGHALLELSVDTAGAGTLDGLGAGALLLDRVYAGMRAATRAAAWPQPSR